MKGVLPTTAVLLAVIAQPAAAAFPGTNGLIAMERPGGGAVSIATVNADGTHDRGGVVAAGPVDRDGSWSPDGRHLAFTSTRDGQSEVYVLDADSGVQTRLTFDPAEDRDPTWSPDGTHIAFDSTHGGNQDIFVMPASGGPPTPITAAPGVDRQAAWSSTGRIAFASNRSGDFELYSVDGGGGDLLQLTQDPGQDADPSWSPDGSRLAFAHLTGGDWDLYDIGANGQNQRALANSPSDDHFPAWSPDGTRIAFVRGSFGLSVMSAEGESAGVSRLTGVDGTDPNWGPVPTPIAGPDLGQTVTVAPLDAQVLIAPATSQAPNTTPVLQAQLRTANEVPTGSSIDARAGTVAIEAVTTTPDGPNTVGRAEVTGGVFTVDQIGTSEPSLRMRRGIRPCQPIRAARVPPEARMRIKVRGRFRTVGGYGRGAGRGTEWVMRERCDGTVFRVFEGVVSVHDYTRKRTVDVKAGRCYLAATRIRKDAAKPKKKCPQVRRAR